MTKRVSTASENQLRAVRADQVISRRDNNFDVLRLVAASLVLVSHAYALTGRLEPAVPYTNDTLGFDAVLIFFAASGMLITRSWLREPRASLYVTKRCLRILPALAVSSIVTAFILGPLVTNLSMARYARDPSTLTYVVSNSLFRTDYSLAGVFGGNPISTVNGSLGTLPTEVRAYMLVLFIGMLVRSRRRVHQVAWIGLTVVAIAASFTTGVKPPATVVILFATFGGGAVLALLRSYVPIRVDLALGSLAAWVASYHVPWALHVVLLAVSVPYIVVYLGGRVLNGIRFVTRPGDVSYGVYVYAFPAEQTAVHLFGASSVSFIIAISGAPTYLLAWLSWRYVEHPSIRLVRLGYRLPGSLGREFARPGSHAREDASVLARSLVP